MERDTVSMPDNTGERSRVSWLTVAVLATAIAYIDGFCVTSLHGAVGAVRNSQQPLLRWLRDSTMMLPPLLLAVLAALYLTRHVVGENRRELVRLAMATLLLVVITSAVSIAEVSTNAVADYTIQVHDIGVLSHAGHFSAPVAASDAVAPTGPGTCTATCAARHLTIAADVRAVGDAAIVLLAVNVALVLWVLALRGGRLWVRRVPAANSAPSQELGNAFSRV